MPKFQFGQMLHSLRQTYGVELTPTKTEEWTNVATADVDAIKTSIASAATQQTYTGAALNGVVGAGTMSPPRNMTITTSAHANIDAVAVVITGTDVDGNVISDTITLTDGGNATDVGVKAFATVTQIVVPAQSGTGGLLQFGFGAIIGLAQKARTRAGGLSVMCEVSGGAIVANGVFAVPATGAPNGTYAPNAAPDGSRDYSLTYELDVTEFSS